MQTGFAQNITGNVTNENGVPLPGANVVIEGLRKEFLQILTEITILPLLKEITWFLVLWVIPTKLLQ